VNVIETEIAAVKIIEPKVFGDARGFFFESWNAKAFNAAGLDLNFVQDNHSRSVRGVLRGLHYQLQQTQGKLVRVVAGSVFDVAVDLRRSSPTFGKHVAVVLSAGNKRQLWIPPGFAHGFLCLEDGTEFVYKCTNYYAPQYECSLLWSDEALAIRWPSLDAPISVSAKDAVGKPLSKAETFP